jgi:ribose transport system ATP-binding protein
LGQDVASRSPLVNLTGITKRYGETRALADAHLQVGIGEIVGIVGHNGAGKSTLMRVLGGTTTPDSGSILVCGRDVTHGFSVDRARALGIRSVYQELSLCPNLRVFENVRILHPALRGVGWRTRASELIEQRLRDVFPGHGIAVTARVGDLTIGQRQMVEIARAVSVTDTSVSLLILDEPTSSLDAAAAAHLFTFLKREKERGLSCLFISHRLGEILGQTDRVVVMRDGSIVATGASSEFSRARLVALMGDVAQEQAVAARSRAAQDAAPVYVDVKNLSDHILHDVTMHARSGEVVGLAGLAGHGQRELLLALFAAHGRSIGPVRLAGPVAYVSGDRQVEGIFQFWPVARNISVGVMSRLSRGGLVNTGGERILAREWVDRLQVRGGAASPVTNLSGGNQQKVLVARALASDAKIVLFDDPTRGVDVGTKRQLYEMVYQEAQAGRCFIWYTTEGDELRECDRVYVFRAGRIVDEVSHGAISEDRIIAASFREAGGMMAGSGA